MNIGKKTAPKSCRNCARETESAGADAEFGVRVRILPGISSVALRHESVQRAVSKTTKRALRLSVDYARQTEPGF